MYIVVDVAPGLYCYLTVIDKNINVKFLLAVSLDLYSNLFVYL